MRMHLNDPICRPSFINSTHVSFKMPLGGCGSRHITSPRKVVFTNRVFIVENSYHGYKKKEMKTMMEIHFLCKYRRVGLFSESVSQKRRLLWEMKKYLKKVDYCTQDRNRKKMGGGDSNLDTPSAIPLPLDFFSTLSLLLFSSTLPLLSSLLLLTSPSTPVFASDSFCENSTTAHLTNGCTVGSGWLMCCAQPRRWNNSPKVSRKKRKMKQSLFAG